MALEKKVISEQEINSEELYEVEEIIGHQIKKREIKLLIKWLGYKKPTYESFN